MLRVLEPLQDRIEDDLLDQAAPNEQLVVAGSLGCANASIVPPPLPLTCAIVAPHLPQNHRSREQVRGEVFLPTSLLRGESALSDSAGPAPAYFFAPEVFLRLRVDSITG